MIFGYSQKSQFFFWLPQLEMNSSDVDAIRENISAIGLTGKYSSGSLTPMGLTGPTSNPFLSIPEPGANMLAPVMRGGKRKSAAKRQSRRRRRRRRRATR